MKSKKPEISRTTQKVRMQSTQLGQDKKFEVNFVEKKSEKNEDVLIFFKDCTEFLTMKTDELNQKLKNKIQIYCFDVEDQKIASILLINDKYIILDSFTEVLDIDSINLEKKIVLINSYSNSQKLKLIFNNKFNKKKEIEYFNSRNIFELNKINFYTTLKDDRTKTNCSSLIEKLKIENSILESSSIEDLCNSLPGSLYILNQANLIDRLIDPKDIGLFINSISEVERTMNIDQNIYLSVERLEKMCSLFERYMGAIPPQFTNFNLVSLTSSFIVRDNRPYVNFNLNLKVKNEIIRSLGEKLYNSIDWNTVYLSGGSLLNIIQRVLFGRDYPINHNQDIDLFVNRKHFKPFSNNVVDMKSSGNIITYTSIETQRKIEFHLTTCDNIKVINNFDFMFQRCFWNQRELFISPLALFGLFNQINFQYSSTRAIKIERMSKYIERGYKFIINDIESQKIKTFITEQQKTYRVSKCMI